jgi:UDP-N-acetylmuramate dehydrogenase
MSWEKAISAFKEKFGHKFIPGRPLADLNCFGTGGDARLYVEITSADELIEAIKTANEYQVPYFMLGGGSNILVSDSGYDGLVIRNSIMGLKVDGEKVTAGAGEELADLISFSAENGLSGLEFAAGIYGTVGGAVCGNAGAYGAEIKDVFESAQLVDEQGNIRTEKPGYFEFGYRSSKLKKTREMITDARFALKKGKKDAIVERIEEILKIRKAKLPATRCSAGCFFKNIPDKREKFGKLSAGKLLDEVGAKELSYGGARVFEKHANILMNAGTANSSEIRRLSNLLKKRVKEKFGIELKEEIVLLGDFNEEVL